MDIVQEAELLEEALDVIRKNGYNVKKLNEDVAFRDTDFTKVCEKYLSGSFFAILAKQKSLAYAINMFLDELAPFVGHGISKAYFAKFTDRIKKSKSASDAMFKISNAMLAGGGHALV